MTMFIPANTAVENTRNLAHSALPDAPVVSDDRHRSPAPDAHRVGAALQSAGRRTLKIAHRIDPLFDRQTS